MSGNIKSLIGICMVDKYCNVLGHTQGRVVKIDLNRDN